MIYNLYLNYAAIVILAVLLAAMTTNDRALTFSGRAFRRTLWLTMAFCVTDFLASVCETAHGRLGGAAVLVALDSLYFFLPVLIGAGFSFYVLSLAEADVTKKEYRLTLMLPVLSEAVVLIINVFVPLMFRIRPGTLRYSRGPLLFISYITVFWYILLGLFIVFRFRQKLTFRCKTVLSAVLILQVGGFLIQQVHPYFLATDCSLAIAMILIYAFLENSSEFYSERMSVLNYKAYLHQIRDELELKKSFLTIFIRVGSAYSDTKISGSLRLQLIKRTIEYYRTFGSELTAYLWNDRTIALDMRRPDPQRAMEIMEEIEKRFHEPWQYGEYSFYTNATEWACGCPFNVSGVNDLCRRMQLLEYAGIGQHKGIISMSEFDFTSVERSFSISAGLRDKISDGSLEVRYQPVWNRDSGSFDIVRAKIFIREKDGTVRALRDMILRGLSGAVSGEMDEYELTCACRDMHRVFQNCGIRKISVRLSDAELERPDFSSRMLSVLAQEGTEPEQMIIRVSDADMSRLDEPGRQRVDWLSDRGFTVMVDNFGSDYSVMSRLMTFHTALVALDSGILDNVGRNPGGEKGVASLVSGIHDLGMKVVLKNVNGQTERSVADRMNADLICGRIYSDYLPVSDMAAWLEDERTGIRKGGPKQ